MTRLPVHISAALLGLAAYAIFSTHDVIVKILGETYSPIQILFFSALLGFPLIALYLVGGSGPHRLRPVHPWWVALRSVSAAIAALSAFYAFSVLPLSQAYAFIFATPLLITVLAVPMLGETIRRRRGIAVLAGLCGVLVVLRPGATPLELGHMAAMMAAVAGAFNAIVVRKIGRDENVVVMVLYPFFANLLIAGMALPFVYVAVELEHLGMFAVISALVLAAMAVLVVAYGKGPALVVAPMQYSQLLWGTLYGAVLFGERPDWPTYLGAAIIVVSGIYILKREATGNVSANRPVLTTKTRSGHAVSLRVDTIMRSLKRGSSKNPPNEDAS